MARRLKQSRGSSPQGFQLQNPRGANPDVVVAVAAPVADAETVLVEAADTRDITSIGRVGLDRPFLARGPDIRVEPFASLPKA
ncbi:hypothetical protein A3B85_01450 [Candidatus Nomurabacteria bacterium RIFCSPHIGHO2_02_FULL_37_13]|uniref:Uncharacterized protein n=1 Tax=Candidatus Nomurabacteria bacterium RIFCSPHIGHO2_02_FULL_37_13 TaxID=1801750 RepID=A0A1F6W760_9BACT|nr:MAG: hypothetical protein A2640_02940 [Candidatus Nomurabacteria bacterium RIFCSPHIGHO2_01_FULL_36_23]OGI77505.1 MAG: hypothetical protein A3B85_01450 [Candidatus Nomurabacteria bacterium RIFCSPHIGHO2_02_FULL_37_13]